MSPEMPSYIKEFIEIAGKKSEQFSQGCDNLVDYQILQENLDSVVQAINNGRNVVLVTNHQSYFEIETQRYFCQLLNKQLNGELHSYLLYSSPAVAHNIGQLLDLRNKTYLDSGLNLLGVIRSSDLNHSIYSQNITDKMRIDSSVNNRKFFNAVRGEGNLIICPFEKTLEGGRLDETGKIKGIQAVDEDSCLSVFINCNCLLLPCGIDGSYKIIDPKTHLPSKELVTSILSPSLSPKEKMVTFKLGNLIDPASLRDLGLTPKDITHKTIVHVASLLSPEAQGVYATAA